MIIFTPPLLPFQCPPGLSGRFPCPSFFSAKGRKAPNSKTTIQGPRPFPFPSPILPTSTSSSLLFRLLLRAKSSSSPFAVCRSPCAGYKNSPRGKFLGASRNRGNSCYIIGFCIVFPNSRLIRWSFPNLRHAGYFRLGTYEGGGGGCGGGEGTSPEKC